MHVSRVKIGGQFSEAALLCDAVTITVGGKRITARVAIRSRALHDQMVKATKNKSKRSLDGALAVTILGVEETIT